MDMGMYQQLTNDVIVIVVVAIVIIITLAIWR